MKWSLRYLREARAVRQEIAEERLRVIMLSPQFAEYSIRLHASLSRFDEVMLVLDRYNASREWPAGCDLVPDSIQTRMLLFNKHGLVRPIIDLFALLWKMISFRPHIVHVQEWPHPNVIFLISLMAPFSNIVVTVHDPAPHSGRDAKIYRPHLRRWLRSTARLLLAHGQYCCHELSKYVVSKRKTIKETAHGTLLIPTSEHIRAPVPGRLLFFGRMEAYKGLEVLLDAADLLVARGVNFSLHLAGHGPELNRLRDRIVAAPWAIVEEAFLSPDAAIAAFQAAEAVVLPYCDATQSGVTAAAFGNGRPVIASRVGGLSDVVQHRVNGLLVPPNNPDSLADALQEALASPSLLSQMRLGAERTARTTMNWDEIAAELHGYYLELIR